VEATPEPVGFLAQTIIVRTDERDQARRFAAAFEARLAEVRTILTAAKDTPADRRVRIRQALRLIDSDLQVTE
jgi:hypothetical protein